jgi:hypothetical protein
VLANWAVAWVYLRGFQGGTAHPRA